MNVVSIVIPVYQVSNYIERCLYSVLNQTYSEIECIIVDDATTDDSIVKCRRIIGNYKGPIRFHIICHEDNQGLSAARNTGTDAATGEYIYYLDSDDEIEPDCITNLIKPIVTDDTIEMVQGNALRICNGREQTAYTKSPSMHLLSNDDVRRHFLKYHNISVFVWNKLLKRSFIKENRLYCKKGILAEDKLWSFYLIKYLKNVYICSDFTYCYHIRPESISTGYNINKMADSYLVIYDDILHNLTKGKERQDLYGYMYGFCKIYLNFVSSTPAFKNTIILYQNHSKLYGCWYVYLVLMTIELVNYLMNPLTVIIVFNKIRIVFNEIFAKLYFLIHEEQ